MDQKDATATAEIQPTGVKNDETVDRLINLVENKVKSKKEEKAKQKLMVSYSKLLLTYADRSDKILIGFGYFTAIATGLGLPSFVFLFGDIVNSFGPSSMDVVAAIAPICLDLTIIGIAIWIATYLYYVFLVIVSERLGKKTRIAYLRAILNQEIAWFDETNSATELPARLVRESQTIIKALGEKMGQILVSLAMSLSGLFFAFFRGWWMSLIFFFLFPLIMFSAMLIGAAIQSGFSQGLKSYGQSAGYAEQALNAIRVVQAFGQETTEMENYQKYLIRAKKAGLKTHSKSATSLGFFFFCMFGYYAYAFYTGSYLITKQVNNSNNDKIYTAGDILCCFFGIVFGVMSLGLAAPNIKAVTEGRIAGRSAFDIIDREPKIKLDSKDYQNVGDIKGAIQFKNVTFRYSTRPEQVILDNFTATFQEGKTTAIVGASGSGKSTIIQLIERFYDPESGSITLDGRDISTLNLRELRRKIGYVGQEPVLFNSTIKENLLYGDPSASDEQIIAALKSANAWDFINQKMGENGINTNVGNAGGQLSGGQKQRIAIARAFIKHPKILLLDEATSALDKKNEQEVQGAIDQIRQSLGSITTIVIAHRLSTIRHADNIIVMQKGRIIEQGNHEALLQNFPDGLYAKFVNEQKNSEDDGQAKQITQEQSEANAKASKAADQVHDKVEKEMKEKHDGVDEVQDKVLEELKEKIKNGGHMGRMLSLSEPKFLIIVGTIFSILTGTVMPFFGIYIGKMLFVLQPDEPIDQAKLDIVRSDSDIYCLAMIILSVLSFFFTFFQIFSFGIIGENVTMIMRKDLYGSILRKHIGWFDKQENTPGVLSAAMASEAQTINGVVAGGLATSLQCLFSLVAGIVIGFIFNWKVSLVVLACSPLMVMSGAMQAKFQKGMSESSDTAMKEANLLAGDSIINYRTVASFANEDQILADFGRLLDGPLLVATSKCHTIGLLFGFSQFITYGAYALMYYVAAILMRNYLDDNLVVDGVVHIDRFIEYSQSIFIGIFAMMMGAMSAGQSQQFGPDVGKANQAAQVIFGIMDVPSQIDAVKEEQKAEETKLVGEIEFRNVWFRYPTRRNDWVLKGLNMKIKPNETVALVGESGCGKSTIVSLILRFYDVNEGSILVDGKDVREWNLKDLRRQMGLVQQEPTLFNYSVVENILYGKADAQNSEVRQAVEISNAIEFIESQEIEKALDETCATLYGQLVKNEAELTSAMGKDRYQEDLNLMKELKEEEEKKGEFIAVGGEIDRREQVKKDITLHNGFNIQCGIKGSKLSGGQKQRIAIARAIIRRPQLLILDEATSALDEESQRKVQVALDNIMKERTSIVIAHRLTTIEKCDRILVLESGRLVEEGGFSELKAKDGGKFAQLATNKKH